MKHYLNDILTRIEKFSIKLDNETVLMKQHWIVLDEEENSKKVYIFRNEGSLLISVNGNVNKAKWELLDFGNMLIENNSNSYLFNHGFLDTEVLILKKDNSNDFFTFVSSVLFQTGIDNLQKLSEYLALKYIKPKSTIENISQSKHVESFQENEIDTFSVQLEDGNDILIEKSFPFGEQVGSKVFNNSKKPLADAYYYLKSMKKIEVKNGEISSISFVVKYEVKGKGELTIEQQDINSPQIGDHVKPLGKQEIEGDFQLSWMLRIYIENGIIVKRKIMGF